MLISCLQNIIKIHATFSNGLSKKTMILEVSTISLRFSLLTKLSLYCKLFVKPRSIPFLEPWGSVRREL